MCASSLLSTFPDMLQLQHRILSCCFPHSKLCSVPQKHSYSCFLEPSLSIYCWLSCPQRIPCLANINDCEVSPVGVCFGRDACLKPSHIILLLTLSVLLGLKSSIKVIFLFYQSLNVCFANSVFLQKKFFFLLSKTSHFSF